MFRWELNEVEFWSDNCPWDKGKYKLLPADFSNFSNLSVISSGDLVDPCCSAKQAFDGLARTDFTDGTAWVSDCRSCGPGQAWIGFDAGTMTRFRVACVVLQQGRDATSQCERIVVEASNDPDSPSWAIRGEISGFGVDKYRCIARTREDYPLLECGAFDDGCRGTINFGDCPGHQEVCENNRCRCTRRDEESDLRFADWECGTTPDGCNGTLDFGTCPGSNATCTNNVCKDDNFKASMWRLLCESGTVGRWWIRELEFHQEGLCLQPIKSYRKSISSGSYDASHPERHAFDGNAGTFWMSDCRKCRANGAWIGIDFGRQLRVACVRLHQHESTINQCQRVILEYSDDGTKWKERYRYGFGDYSLHSDEELTGKLDDENSDSELRPPKRMANWWRVVCDVTLEPRWGIYELDFYDDEACTSSLRRGIKSIVHSRGSTWSAENALDWRPETLWKTGCGSPCNGGVCKKCNRGKTYLGVQFEKLVIVRCVKLHQLEGKDELLPGGGLCPKIILQFSLTGGGNEWLMRDTFEEVPKFAYLKPYQTPTDVGFAPRKQALGTYWAFLLVLTMLSASFRIEL